MLTNEDLLSISRLLDAKLDSKLQPILERLNRIEQRQENDIIPRLQNIESCYLSTYERYKESTAGYEAMQADIEILKKVTAEHSEKLRRLA